MAIEYCKELKPVLTKSPPLMCQFSYILTELVITPCHGFEIIAHPRQTDQETSFLDASPKTVHHVRDRLKWYVECLSIGSNPRITPE